MITDIDPACVKHLNKVSDLYQQLYDLKVVLPGFRRCAICGQAKKIVNAQGVTAMAHGESLESMAMLVALCAECHKSGKVFNAEIGQFHPEGYTPIEDKPMWSSKEQYLMQILKETRRYYQRHPQAYKVMKNGGPAYQSPTAQEYLEHVDRTFEEAHLAAVKAQSVIQRVK